MDREGYAMQNKVKVLANLDRGTYERLASLSRQTGNPMTFYIRHALTEYLNRIDRSVDSSSRYTDDSLSGIVGALDSGLTDLSSDPDRYLYGSR